MPQNARVARGRRTQVVVAAWLREHGWDRARAPVGAETGQDVKDLPVGVSVEIKARADFNPLAWLLQAKKNARPGDRPLVVIRCNKQGERAGEYLVIRCLDDDVLALGPQAMVMLRDLDVELNHPEFGLRYAPQVVGTEHSNQPEDNGGTSD